MNSIGLAVSRPLKARQPSHNSGASPSRKTRILSGRRLRISPVSTAEARRPGEETGNRAGNPRHSFFLCVPAPLRFCPRQPWLVILHQIHAFVQAGHLIAVAVEHQRVAPPEFTQTPLLGL